MLITDEQLETFTGQPNPTGIPQNFLSKFNPTFAKSSAVEDGLANDFWGQVRIDIARKNLHHAIGVGELHPPSKG